MTSRLLALSQYRNLLQGANRFKSYEYREYIKRRTKEEFHKHQQETNPKIIQQLLQKAQTQNLIVQRQATINAMYSKDDLVLTLKKTRITK